MARPVPAIWPAQHLLQPLGSIAEGKGRWRGLWLSIHLHCQSVRPSRGRRAVGLKLAPFRPTMPDEVQSAGKELLSLDQYEIVLAVSLLPCLDSVKSAWLTLTRRSGVGGSAQLRRHISRSVSWSPMPYKRPTISRGFCSQTSQGKTRDLRAKYLSHLRPHPLGDVGLRVLWPPRPDADA